MEQIEKLIDQEWFTADQPWGDGTWIVAGNPDPHLGEQFSIDFDFDWADRNGSVARALAAHIVETHNLKQLYEKLYLAARDLLELAEFCDDDQMIIHQDNHDAMAEALRAVYQEKLKIMGPAATRAEHNRRMMREY